jgi:hypothetical protein
MRGSIVKRKWKRSVSWAVVVDAGSDGGGRRRQRWTTFTTRREAEAYLQTAGVQDREQYKEEQEHDCPWDNPFRSSLRSSQHPPEFASPKSTMDHNLQEFEERGASSFFLVKETEHGRTRS